MPGKFTIRIDLLSDYLNMARTILGELGYIPSSPDDALITYHTFQQKLIFPKPRSIKKSIGFSCPLEHQQGLELIESKILSGDDLRLHQSKWIYNLKKKDGLLFHWDIYHLHLGTALDSDGFMDRTGPLLYVRFTNDTAYFLGIDEHGLWTKQEFIKTIHENWPESIEQYHCKGAVGLERSISDADVFTLRQNRMNAPIEVAPNFVYANPGLGVAASGHPIEAVWRSDELRDKIESTEKWLHQNIDTVLEHEFPNKSFLPNLEFELASKGNQLVIMEMTNFLFIDFNTLKFIK